MQVMRKKVGLLVVLVLIVIVLGVTGKYNGIIGIIKQNTEDLGEFGGSRVISEIVVPSGNTVAAQEEPQEIDLQELQKLSYTDGYAYNLLTEQEKEIYVEILGALEQLAEDVIVSSSDVDQVVKIHEYVCADNPELFWVNGYQIVPYEMAGKTVKVKYSGLYTMKKGEKENYQLALERAVEPWLAEIAKCEGEYAKVKKAYELIILNTEYAPQVKESQNVLSVFLEGKSVCQGYAEAFQYLCKHSGIQNILVVGEANNGNDTQPHAWNLVSIDGSYYQFDITWGDPNYQVSENVVDEVNWNISYKYFGLTDKEMSENHTMQMEMEVPECKSNQNNYYVKEGYYYESLDKKQLKLQFMAAEETGAGAVHIRCANSLLYDDFVKYLIDDSKVFYIVTDHTEVQYSLDEKMKCISIFWSE